MLLRCALLNCQGLVTKRTNKLKSIEFQQIFKSNDIILLTECWTDAFSDIQVSNFEVFALHRTENKKNCKRNSGGIILYIRNKFVSKDTLVFKSHDDILWIKISSSVLSLSNDLYVCLCYVVPDDSSRQALIETNIFDRILDSFVCIEAKLQNGLENIIICGDFNARSSTYTDFVTDDDSIHMNVLPEDYTPDNFMDRYSQDVGHVNNNGLLLLDLCKQTGLRILNGRVGEDKGVGKYTFVGNRGSSLVDYVLASQNLFDYVTSFKVHDPNILSDHCLLSFSFDFCLVQEVSIASESYEYVDGKFVWKSEFKDEYINRLNDASTLQKLNTLSDCILRCSEETEVKSCIKDFESIFEDVCAPIYKKSKQPCTSSTENFSNKKENPWYTEECQEKKYCFLYLLDKYRKSKSDINRMNMIRARSEYKMLLRKCRYEYDRDKTNKFVGAKHKNAKLYWNMLKELSYVKPANIPLSSFEEYFQSVNNPSDPFYAPDEDILHFNERYVNNEFCVMFDELNTDFSHEEILKSIKQLKTNKSGGPDRLINEFFIHGKHVLLPILSNLFNKIFENGVFPEEWSEGYVIPLHKKGNKSEVGNYRGITLLSSLGKLFTRIINNRLTGWSEKYFVLIEAQAGFRPNMSTVDDIFILHSLLTHVLNHGNKLYCAFVDFTKAFDYIVRDNLWYKMIKLGLRGKILSIIKSMYSVVKSRVKYDGKLGNEFYCCLGVRQGECLSPLLFSMFINDLEETFIKAGYNGLDIDMFKIFMLLYADDIVLFSNSAQELQEGLNLLAEYCNRWKMKVNVDKTKIMVFRKGGMLPRNLSFTYNGEALEIVNKFRYLGVVFTVGGSFSEAQITLAGQAQKAIFQLNRYLYKFTFLTPRHKVELFDKLIVPILNYGGEVWGFAHANVIEKVQLQFCKRLLGVKKTTQNDFVYGELGRTTCIIKRYLLIIKYWFKILQSNSTKYIKVVYNMMLHDMETRANITNWASLVCHLLETMGFQEVWLQQGVGNFNRFISLFKQRLTDNFIQNWHSRIKESTRAIFYRSFASFQFQPYLDKINVNKYLQAFCKLRMSSHRLEVESGRWVRPNRIPLDERKCSFCQVLEDEFHFVIECPLYEVLRKKYIAKYFWTRPNMYKFIELINSTNTRYLRKLCIFIYQAFKLRTEYLYTRS